LEHSRTVQLEPKIRQMVILVFRFIIFNKWNWTENVSKEKVN
jgi:poly(A) polymerase Pap1